MLLLYSRPVWGPSAALLTSMRRSRGGCCAGTAGPPQPGPPGKPAAGFAGPFARCGKAVTIRSDPEVGLAGDRVRVELAGRAAPDHGAVGQDGHGVGAADRQVVVLLDEEDGKPLLAQLRDDLADP